MKNLIYTSIFLLTAIAAQAQEQAIYAHYQLFPILVNPGYTGFENKHQFVLNGRQNWAGFPGAPKTYTLVYNGPLSERLGIGAGIFSEKIGSISTTRMQLSYAFRFKVQRANLGIGLSTEFINRDVTGELLTNPLVENGDAVLEGATTGQKIFDASIGMYSEFDNKFYIGLSLPNSIRARLDEAPIDQQTTNGSLFDFYIFQLGYKFDMKEQNIKLVPSLAFRKVRNVPFQVDLSLTGRFLDEKLIAGLTFRPSSGGSASFLIGTKLKTVEIIYSYDVGFTPFAAHSSGSHEFTVGFSFDKKMAKFDPSAPKL